jgi:hypothetical protein
MGFVYVLNNEMCYIYFLLPEIFGIYPSSLLIHVQNSSGLSLKIGEREDSVRMLKTSKFVTNKLKVYFMRDCEMDPGSRIVRI